METFSPNNRIFNPIEEQITITLGEKFYIKSLKKVKKIHQSSNTNIDYDTVQL